MPPKSGDKRPREEWEHGFGADAEFFRRTLRFLFSVAVERLFPDRRMKGGHSIGNGYWYRFEGKDDDGPASDDDCKKITEEIQALIGKKLKITLESLAVKDAIEYFMANGQPIAGKLLSKRVPVGGLANLKALKVDGKVHYRHNFFPLLDSTADLTRPFSISPYDKGGLVLCEDVTFFDQTRIENKISEACAEIVAKNAKKKIRVVAIAGPTASGKTTFSHKLALSLRAFGILAQPLTVDHYYLPLDQQPKYQARKLRSDVDYDAIESMDLELVQKHIMALSNGETVMTPVYNMKTGYREETGIHALNPNYTEKLKPDEKFKIFISPMTALQIDDFNVFKTTDHRLGRRMCRDYLFRGNDAARTLSMWGNVRQGEHRWIFPHQNNADFVFNSAMECELPLLKGRLDMLLRSVPPENADFSKATHLLQILDTLPTWQESGVAATSILREFIGGSLFDVH